VRLARLLVLREKGSKVGAAIGHTRREPTRARARRGRGSRTSSLSSGLSSIRLGCLLNMDAGRCGAERGERHFF
jgi:hypothetical protein